MQKIKVKVIPNSVKSQLVKLEDSSFKAYVSCSAIKGKANAAVIELLSHEFNVAKKDVEILLGKTSPNKLIKIR
ncbi:MAG: DUF167 domain-containing protein [Clostridiales bacterium]|nr:DUF167 domain-containing protein [Clostridiales bacterium]